ncbi:MAG: hypothetical protein HKL87_03660 [Acidimicrobiaceae bacterium]|nr:hypothetical protein [Acidimicrobiaceae bacterium]
MDAVGRYDMGMQEVLMMTVRKDDTVRKLLAEYRQSRSRRLKDFWYCLASNGFVLISIELLSGPAGRVEAVDSTATFLGMGCLAEGRVLLRVLRSRRRSRTLEYPRTPSTGDHTSLEPKNSSVGDEEEVPFATQLCELRAALEERVKGVE